MRYIAKSMRYFLSTVQTCFWTLKTKSCKNNFATLQNFLVILEAEICSVFWCEYPCKNNSSGIPKNVSLSHNSFFWDSQYFMLHIVFFSDWKKSNKKKLCLTPFIIHHLSFIIKHSRFTSVSKMTRCPQKIIFGTKARFLWDTQCRCYWQ